MLYILCKMKASDLFGKCLENEGVELIFGLPGEENEDLMISLSDSKIKFITTRHEQGAAFMADVYGRLTGKAGVCMSTLGPGATNLITGVADADLDNVPIVAITGQGELSKQHKESHQFVDIVKAFSPFTKWNSTVVYPEIIPEVVRKAFKIAKLEKPGATHIELPEDVARKSVGDDVSPLRITPNPKFVPDDSEIAKAVDLLRNAKSPVILAGNGVIRLDASKELVGFAEKISVHVANTFMSKGVIPYEHPLSLFTLGMQARDYVMCNFDMADLVITVGYDIVEYSPSYWNPHKDKKIIHIGPDASEIDECYRVDAELVGDVKFTLKRLAELVDFRKANPYPMKLREFIVKEFEHFKESKDFPMKPQKIILDLRDAMAHEDILISDVGAHKIWIARMFPAYVPNKVIISNGFASMGIALPGAVAAKLAKPYRKVVAVTGDGGFLMNSQEIETAKRLNLAFVVVVFSDGRFGLTSWKQKLHLKKEFGQKFNNPDFVKYAESFGAVGIRIEKADDLLPALKKAIATDNVVVIEVPVDFDENFRLSEELEKDVCRRF